ncbi:hypothetical protein ACFLS4_03255 [Bacteroidota bacterium]
MKKYFVIVILVILGEFVIAQESIDTIDLKVEDVSIEMLKSPTNSAFLLMNTSPTEIVEPGSAPEFFTSIQNASDNFSSLPNNYGFSVTPFWWFEKAKKLSFEEEYSEDNPLKFFRTLSLSGGIVQGINDNEETWRYGFGFQSTLFRGKVDNKKKKEYFNTLRTYHTNYYGTREDYLKKNKDYMLLEEKRVNLNLSIKRIDFLIKGGSVDEAAANLEKTEITHQLQTVLSDLNTLKDKLDKDFDKKNKSIKSTDELDKKFNTMNERLGLKWDIGGGFAINSQNNKTDSTNLYRIGFWSNFGGNIITSETNSTNFAGFLLVRYLYYDEINYLVNQNVELVENLSTFDAGVKFQLELIDKFSFSIEAIYRMGLSDSNYEDNYKINGLAQYQLGKNRLIYASLGNNFNDETDAGPEDLIVTFGVNIGFGDNIDIFDIKF